MNAGDSYLPTPAAENRFLLDPEHAGLRAAMLLGFLLVWLLVFLLGRALLQIEGAVIISIGAGFAAATLLSQRMERWLKPRWPSGRSVALEGRRIRLLRRGQEQEALDLEQEINVLTWCFRINRRSRVPKGWFMVACALEQDERHIPVYAFMPPEEFEQLQRSGLFTQLQGRRQRRDSGDLRLAGEQKRLHGAEQIRWLQGGEMARDEFRAYLRFLHRRFPEWMPDLV